MAEALKLWLMFGPGMMLPDCLVAGSDCRQVEPTVPLQQGDCIKEKHKV